MNSWILYLTLPALLGLTSSGWGLSRPNKPPEDDQDHKSNMIPLPQPILKGMTVEEAIRARRSMRQYSQRPLNLQELSQVLFAAQGITGQLGSFPLRAAPSAGALYPIELYVVANNVRDLRRGLYHYSPQHHTLELIKSGDYRSEISQCCLDQNFVGQSGAALVMTAIFGRTTAKYGQRGVSYVYMEAGHISQNIYLQAVSLGLGSLAVGAFNDRGLNALLGVDGYEERVIYVNTVGGKRGTPE